MELSLAATRQTPFVLHRIVIALLKGRNRPYGPTHRAQLRRQRTLGTAFSAAGVAEITSPIGAFMFPSPLHTAAGRSWSAKPGIAAAQTVEGVILDDTRRKPDLWLVALG
jgi:hypothetical protein